MARKIKFNEGKKDMSPPPKETKKSAKPLGEISMVKEDMKWKADQALSDILRAEEHKQDPELMKEVLKLADKKKKAICCIEDLREEYNSMPHDSEAEMESEDESE